jgi:hypothetical protein
MKPSPVSRTWFAFAVASLLATGALGGCVRVKPYEREIMSLRPMSGDDERVEDKFRQHWQESREGGAGGYAAAGGGCGCN